MLTKEIGMARNLTPLEPKIMNGFSIPIAIHKTKNLKDKKLSEFVTSVSVYLAFLEAIVETLSSAKN